MISFTLYFTTGCIIVPEISQEVDPGPPETQSSQLSQSSAKAKKDHLVLEIHQILHSTLQLVATPIIVPEISQEVDPGPPETQSSQLSQSSAKAKKDPFGIRNTPNINIVIKANSRLKFFMIFLILRFN
jgi:hypothetical protein